MGFLSILIRSRVAQIIISIALTAALVGGYGWWQKRMLVAELNRNIEVLESQAKSKTADRDRYIEEDKEAKDAIETKDVETFVNYWNSTN